MLPNIDDGASQGTDALAIEIPSFVVGKAYSRREEITGKFGGSAQSGIAPSRQSPAIFLFTGTGEQHGYTDSFDAFGCLRYVGEGQLGDMKMTKGNLAIASHAKDGRALHVFEMTGKGKPCVYKGEFTCASHFTERGPDREGKERDLVLFWLVPVSSTLRQELDSAEVDAPSDTNDAVAEDLSELRQAAISACQPGGPIPAPKEAVRITYQRSARVKRYVLARAQGHCELCDAPAPFNRRSDGTPYLEPHHINRLSDGGLDHPKYVGAICPTCHRLIHFGVNGQHRNDELKARVEAKEAALAAKDLL